MNVSEHVGHYLSSELKDLIPRIEYKPSWMIRIGYELGEEGDGGYHLFITSHTTNSLVPSETIRVHHGFLIPSASYNRNSWVNWIFERLREVETHEAGEFFKVDGLREFAPHHSNGENPYTVWHTGDYATAKKKSGDA